MHFLNRMALKTPQEGMGSQVSHMNSAFSHRGGRLQVLLPPPHCVGHPPELCEKKTCVARPLVVLQW